jgi:chromosome segregation ATPase
VDKAKDEPINKLTAGQEKIGKDISEMKEDISALKNGQEKMGKDIFALQVGQEKLNEDLSVLKQDVSELKTSVGNLEVAFLKQLDIMTNVQRIVINIENDLRPRVSTLFDADKVRQHDATELKQICREQEDRLEDHELRISRLEK